MDRGDPFLFDNFFRRPGGRKVDLLVDSIRRLHEPLEGLGPPFVQQRLLPELLRPIGPPQGAHKSTNVFFHFFFCRLGARKVDPLGGSIRRLPDPLGGSGQIFVQQRRPPELPRATGPPQGALKRTKIFTKKLKKIVASKSRPSRGLDLSAPCSSGGFRPKLC